MAFNLEDYEDVATLNKWFITNYPMGRSDLSVVSFDAEKGYILIQATLWRDSKDAAPAVSNLAFGSRETYIPNMKKFYVEDTATSALGRAIIILKGSDKTATKDDMRKVERGARGIWRRPRLTLEEATDRHHPHRAGRSGGNDVRHRRQPNGGAG